MLLSARLIDSLKNQIAIKDSQHQKELDLKDYEIKLLKKERDMYQKQIEMNINNNSGMNQMNSINNHSCNNCTELIRENREYKEQNNKLMNENEELKAEYKKEKKKRKKLEKEFDELREKIEEKNTTKSNNNKGKNRNKNKMDVDQENESTNMPPMPADIKQRLENNYSQQFLWNDQELKAITDIESRLGSVVGPRAPALVRICIAANIGVPASLSSPNKQTGIKSTVGVLRLWILVNWTGTREGMKIIKEKFKEFRESGQLSSLEIAKLKDEYFDWDSGFIAFDQVDFKRLQELRNQYLKSVKDNDSNDNIDDQEMSDRNSNSNNRNINNNQNGGNNRNNSNDRNNMNENENAETGNDRNDQNERNEEKKDNNGKSESEENENNDDKRKHKTV